MKKFIKIAINLLIVIIAMSSVTNASAATYYVATSGSDSNSGTQASPFKSITKGVNVIKAGDTLLVGPGTYNESFESSFPSGTDWSSPVIVKALDPASPPLLKPYSAGFVFYFSNGQKYITLDGFILDGENVEHDTLKITEGANHIRVINSEIRNSPKQGILVTGEGSEFNEFINLFVHDNGTRIAYDHGFYINTSNNLVDSCIVTNNAAFGIHLWNTDSETAVNNNIVRNNIVFGHNNGKPGILLSRGNGNIAYNNIVYNNSIGISANYNATNAKIYNNTIYNNSGEAIAIGDAPNVTIANNIIYKNGSVGDAGTNSLTIDPKFVNEAAGDLHIQDGSPAIDAGIALPEVLTDIDYGIRPNGIGVDIGADEFGVVGVNQYGLNPFFTSGYSTPSPTPTPTIAPYPSPEGFDYITIVLMFMLFLPVLLLLLNR